MNAWVLLLLFCLGAGLGYRVIRQVPSLLHTPLMSGMNALSGVTVLGALAATVAAVTTGDRACAALAVALAMVNIVGGFLVTHRMLRMFKPQEEGGEVPANE